MQRILVILTLILFGALTVAALWQDGILKIFSSIPQSLGSLQIYLDLVIACSLINVWIWHDAKKHGRNPWLWIIATFIVGSFSPLIYLLARPTATQEL
jgi:RsiW-degrading membrane proteinase PrsW (M82 family)